MNQHVPKPGGEAAGPLHTAFQKMSEASSRTEGLSLLLHDIVGEEGFEDPELEKDLVERDPHMMGVAELDEYFRRAVGLAPEEQDELNSELAGCAAALMDVVDYLKEANTAAAAIHTELVEAHELLSREVRTMFFFLNGLRAEFALATWAEVAAFAQREADTSTGAEQQRWLDRAEYAQQRATD